MQDQPIRPSYTLADGTIITDPFAVKLLEDADRNAAAHRARVDVIIEKTRADLREDLIQRGILKPIKDER